MTGRQGVDISASYQPAEDFAKVAGAGYSFAILKASEGTTWPPADQPALIAWYPARVAAARAAGLTVGAYHFAHPGSNAPGAEAAAFLSRAQLEAGDIVPFLDLETNPHRLTVAQLVGWARSWLAQVEGRMPAGSRAGVYTDVSYLHGDLGGWNLDGRPLWLADPSNTSPSLGRVITQTGQRTVPGIGAGVDVNSAAQLPLIGATAAQATTAPPTAPAHPAGPPGTEWTPDVHNIDLSHVTSSAASYVHGPGVRPLQCLLRQYVKAALVVDGIGGPDTAGCLASYQARARLQVDKVAGPATFGSLLGQS